eukprot:scaffold170_cov281-Pinguiococcus_pyrenoidosus.AAC.8
MPGSLEDPRIWPRPRLLYSSSVVMMCRIRSVLGPRRTTVSAMLTGTAGGGISGLPISCASDRLPTGSTGGGGLWNNSATSIPPIMKDEIASAASRRPSLKLQIRSFTSGHMPASVSMVAARCIARRAVREVGLPCSWRTPCACAWTPIGVGERGLGSQFLAQVQRAPQLSVWPSMDPRGEKDLERNPFAVGRRTPERSSLVHPCLSVLDLSSSAGVKKVGTDKEGLRRLDRET